MMDRSVQPGSHASFSFHAKRFFMGLCGFITAILIGIPAAILFLIFFLPVTFTLGCFNALRRDHYGKCASSIGATFALVLGILLNCIFAPCCLIIGLCFLTGLTLLGIGEMCRTGFRACFKKRGVVDPAAQTESENENQRNAEERMRQR